MFETRVVEEKVPNPSWNFKASHLLEIDEDMLVKLQSDLITVAVYGMQDGCDRLRKKAN